MNPRVLLILTHDPRLNARALEGVRLAAGVGAWRRVELRLYLEPSALHLLDPAVEELDDGADYLRYLAVLGDLQSPIHIPVDATVPPVLAEPRLRLQPTPARRLAELAADSDYVMRF